MNDRFVSPAELEREATDAMRRGAFAEALERFRRIADSDGRDPRQWVNVARALRQLGDDAGEEAALFKAASVDPSDLATLLARGALYERQGRRQQAAAAFSAAATVSPPLDRLLPEYRSAVKHAMDYRDRHQREFAAFIDAAIEPALAVCNPATVARFKLSLDMLVGRKRRFDPQPMRYYMPQLPVIEFFDRASMPWLEAVEAATDEIRAELLAVIADDRGKLDPYIHYDADQPVAQWAELNHSPRWSAFHLVKNGQPVIENVARCPATMAAWREVPSPEQPGRTPVALFSLLKPRTHIPPHVGASNARLVAHLPLIVPPGCEFRVGNSVREWVPGRAWAFDDTIEHEAWNRSDQLRAVLIFDIWHPLLNHDERRMITALNAALNAFAGSASADYDV